MILCIISFDVFSYVFGSLFGKNKLFKYISPNKTVEGLICGILLSLLSIFIYCILLNISFNLKIISFTFLTILLSFLGDIIESVFKRLNEIKNSSNFLPGHGGFFDRFDSFILNIISYSLLYNYL